ncbi:hypothetical protein CK203_064079 [Vitis vinifera]|uniref:Uncharacterized protein n=1 Tax=Vitis vinifera TaxID=29760 RepID=A0A438G429_VITVI|nr:hypothetical protein CK203_064079 [Vitis vinifera]
MMIPRSRLWRDSVEKSPYHPSLSIEQRQVGKGTMRETRIGKEREKWTWKVKEQKHGTLIEKGIMIKNRNKMRLMRTERK